MTTTTCPKCGAEMTRKMYKIKRGKKTLTVTVQRCPTCKLKVANPEEAGKILYDE